MSEAFVKIFLENIIMLEFTALVAKLNKNLLYTGGSFTFVLYLYKNFKKQKGRKAK